MLTGIFTAAVVVIGTALAALVAVGAGFLVVRRTANVILHSGISLPPVMVLACENLCESFSYDVDEALEAVEPLTYVAAIVAAILCPPLGLLCFCASVVVSTTCSMVMAVLDRYFPNATPAIRLEVIRLAIYLGLAVTEIAVDEMLDRNSSDYPPSMRRRRRHHSKLIQFS
jgi:hypothetical protein